MLESPDEPVEREKDSVNVRDNQFSKISNHALINERLYDVIISTDTEMNQIQMRQFQGKDINAPSIHVSHAAYWSEDDFRHHQKRVKALATF